MAKRNKPVTEEAASVPISSMIDIIFLLIIFFIVTATLDKEIEDEQILLADAPHGRPVVKQDPRTITINVRVNGDVKIGEKVLTAGSRENRLPALTALIEEMKRTTPDPLSIPIVIRGDRDVQYFYISRAMNAVKETGLYKVSLVGIQE